MALCDVRHALGVGYLRTGRYAEAAETFQELLGRARSGGYRSRELSALNGLGEALRGTGRAAEAHAHHTVALRLATDLDNLDQQARALDGLAHLRRGAGRPDLARESWGEALRRYAELGVPEADAVREHLAQVDAAPVGAVG
jgi:tetratricopeptide (TPR) repeat protein